MRKPPRDGEPADVDKEAADRPGDSTGAESPARKTYGYDPNEDFDSGPIRPDEKPGLGWLWVPLLLLILGGAFFLRNSFSGGAARVHLADCKQNLRTLAAAVDKWSEGHKGAYPASLDELVKSGALSAVPTCPSAGSSTYRYSLAKNKRTYSIVCSGLYHADVLDKKAVPADATDLPAYSSQTGDVLSP